MSEAATIRPEGLQGVALGRHLALETDCERLVPAVFTEDPETFAVRWRTTEAEIREHLAAEEELVLPAYRDVEPVEAAALFDAHAKIREMLDEIAAHVATCGIHTERLRRLVAALHAHASREYTTLYPWADRNLPELAWERARARIGHWPHRE